MIRQSSTLMIPTTTKEYGFCSSLLQLDASCELVADLDGDEATDDSLDCDAQALPVSHAFPLNGRDVHRWITLTFLHNLCSHLCCFESYETMKAWKWGNKHEPGQLGNGSVENEAVWRRTGPGWHKIRRHNVNIS